MTMRRRGWWPAYVLVLSALLIPGPADAPAPSSAPAAAAPGICTSTGQPALAAQLSQRIVRALHGTEATVGIAVDDSDEDFRCRYHQWRDFHSASVIKVITLG